MIFILNSMSKGENQIIYKDEFNIAIWCQTRLVAVVVKEAFVLVTDAFLKYSYNSDDFVVILVSIDDIHFQLVLEAT